MRRAHLWLAAGVIILAATLAFVDRLGAEARRSGGIASNPETSGARSKTDIDDKASRVADLLDSVIQPRFLEEAGEFGLRRLSTLNGHEPVMFTAQSDGEKKVLEEVKAIGRDYFIAFLHVSHKPGKYRAGHAGAAPRSEIQPYLSHIFTERDRYREKKDRLSSTQWADLLQVAVGELPALRNGKSATASFEKWGVMLRPVSARKSCLDCHAGAKEGETLGVMVYGVANDVAEKSAVEE